MVDCGTPFSTTGVIIEPLDNTKFGSLITFHCEGSNNLMTAVCAGDGEWEPALTSLKCYNSKYKATVASCINLYLIIMHIC